MGYLLMCCRWSRGPGLGWAVSTHVAAFHSPLATCATVKTDGRTGLFWAEQSKGKTNSVADEAMGPPAVRCDRGAAEGAGRS